jgi:hypothetical protein
LFIHTRLSAEQKLNRQRSQTAKNVERSEPRLPGVCCSGQALPYAVFSLALHTHAGLRLPASLTPAQKIGMLALCRQQR